MSRVARQNRHGERAPVARRPAQRGAAAAGRGAGRARGERDDRRGRGLRRPRRRAVARRRVTFLPRTRRAQHRHVRCRPGGCTPTAATASTSAPTSSAATDGVAGAVLLRAAAVESGLDVAQGPPRRLGPPGRPGAGARAICVRRWESPWRTTGLTCSTRRSPVRLTLGAKKHGAVDGPRVGVSQAADRPWRFWLAGRPEVSLYRRSPRAPAPGESD